MDHMIENGYQTCLFLEDDIVFSSDTERIKTDLKLFFNRKYEYDICFLAASRYHKKREKDDLLIMSAQICTTSSAYLLNINSVQKVRNCVFEGYNKLIETEDSNKYCIDRYWTKLQKDEKIFIFKRKMGYQRPSYSNLKKTVTMYLD